MVEGPRSNRLQVCHLSQDPFLSAAFQHLRKFSYVLSAFKKTICWTLSLRFQAWKHGWKLEPKSYFYNKKTNKKNKKNQFSQNVQENYDICRKTNRDCVKAAVTILIE